MMAQLTPYESGRDLRPTEAAEEVKTDQPGEAEQWRLLRMIDESGSIPPGAIIRAWEQKKSLPVDLRAWQAARPETSANPDSTGEPLTAGIQPSGWTWLGPGNIGGRIRSIIVHPSNSQIMWIGSVSGGIWKTTNGGSSWLSLNDFMANLAVSCMAIDPTNPNVLYAGTGEGFFNGDSVQGAGIFKTTDGGSTWTQLSSTTSSNWYYVNRIAINSNNSQIVLAATRSGIWRSSDGGTTWSNRVSTGALDIDFHPTDGSKCVASGVSNAFYSTDGGVSWTPSSGLPSGRIELAYARSNPSLVYASVDNNDGEVYLSSDGGHSFVLRNSGTRYFNADNGGQGWYDNIIWVDPTNSSNLVVGGIYLWRSTNGGTSFTQIGSLHADQHAIVESPQFNGTTNKTVFFGNDGGIYQTGDIYAASPSMTSLNNGLGITQFYSGAGNPASGRIIGGAQDNYTLRYSGSAAVWNSVFCCYDGGFSAADQTDPNFFYGETQWMGIFRSIDGGQSASFIHSGISEAKANSTNFISPFILDPNNPNTLLAGGLSLWRSTNVKATTTAPIWTAIKSQLGSDYRTFSISAIAVAKGNSNIIWVGHDNGDVYYTTNGTATSPSWTRADLGSPALPDRYCARITIDPTNSSRVYVTFGGFSSNNVWRTDNNGATWTNVSGNLPSAPVYTLAVWQQNANYLYVGTEVGIFASADGGQSWSPSNDGPTNCSVDELFWMGDTLVAATHGRGMFSINVASQPTVPLPPTAQAATNVTSSGFTANWSGSSGATGYRLDVSTSSAFSSYVSGYQNLDVGNVLSRAVSGLSAGTTYYYRVRAYNSAGTGGNSSVITVATTTQSSQSELITNSTFASGSTAWTLSGNFFADSRFTNCHSCPGYAYVSNSDGTPGNSLTGIMYQSVNVPSNATSATVSFWYNITTQETTTSTAFDVLNVTLQNSSGGFLSTVATLSNLNATSGYVQRSVSVDLTPYRGQTIRLNFLGTTDSSFPTVFRVDDVSMLATFTTSSVQFSSATYSVNEDGGSKTITVTRTGGTNAFVVNYATSNGTATAGADYTGLNEVLNFATNETSKTFTVPIINDTLVEGNETLNLTLSNPSGGVTLGSPSTAVLTIIDNDTACTYSISESEHTLSPGLSSVNFFMDAPLGCAWTAISDSPSWLTTSSSGSGDGTISYQAAVNQSSNPRVGHITVGGQVHTVTQIGVGGAGNVRFSSVTYSSNEGGADAIITVTRAGGTGDGSVQYSTSNGTATAGTDYVSASGTLFFVGNETSKTFNVTILDDATFEGDESFSLSLKNTSSSFTLGNPSTATLTIIDNDSPPDSTGPGLSINSHGNGDTVSNSTITLSGTASDSGRGDSGISSVTVNGVTASGGTASGSGTANWSRSLTLSQGANNITVVARDNSSNQNSTTQSITLYYQPVQTYTIAVSASPGGGGTVSGGGTFAAGSTRTVTATANSGYTFTNWTEGGSVVSSSASYTFTLNSSRNLVANFATQTTCNANNLALSCNGAVASASSSYNSNYPASATNNGDRRGVNWNAGGGWNDATPNSYPDWLQIDFNASKTVSEVDIFTLQDNPASPVEPGDTMTFTQYGVTAFDVQYWNGSAWINVLGGSVTGNNLVWRKVSFPAVVTSKIRLLVNGALGGYSRLTEVEAYSVANARTNVALARNGATATASSSYSPSYPASAVNNGDRAGINWNNGGGWNDATSYSYPDWVQVSFNGVKTINEIDVFTLQDNPTSPAEPTDAMTFTQYGITSFDVQYWDDGAGWVTVPNGSVTGNDRVKRVFSFSPVTTGRVRVLIQNSMAGYSRVTEVEAYEAPGGTPPRDDVALSSNGATAVASSTYGAGYAVSSVIDGDRKGTNWNNGGGWNDATYNSYPDWVQVNFSGYKRINEIGVYTLQDNPTSPNEPGDGTTFSLYGITDFRVEYWDDFWGWVTVPNGDVTANGNVKRSFPISAVTTNKIRVWVTGSLAGYSRITEVEAFEASPNVASASNGAVASASSSFSPNYPASAVNNGDRRGLNWNNGGGWNDATVNSYPDWLQVDFAGSKTIREVDVFTLQDSPASPVEPNGDTLFSLYGVTAFDVQYWNGSSWVTIPGGSVTGNIQVWRRVTFPAVTTIKIRVVVNDSLGGYSRLTEIEAY